MLSDTLREHIKTTLADWDVPGCSVGIVQQGQDGWDETVEAFGMRDEGLAMTTKVSLAGSTTDARPESSWRPIPSCLQRCPLISCSDAAMVIRIRRESRTSFRLSNYGTLWPVICARSKICYAIVQASDGTTSCCGMIRWTISYVDRLPRSQ
jgi:hypothetical protein